MNGHLITVDGTEHEITAPAVRQLMDSSTRFWLNLSDLADRRWQVLHQVRPAEEAAA
jgi:hypothetical protein